METFLPAVLREASVLPMDAAMQTMTRLTPNDTAIKARRSRMRHCTALRLVVVSSLCHAGRIIQSRFLGYKSLCVFGRYGIGIVQMVCGNYEQSIAKLESTEHDSHCYRIAMTCLLQGK
jgi:hypothetical protein